jgi:hypothetical protein
MPKKTSTQPRRFDCPKCGSVIFRVEVTELTNEIGELLSTTIVRLKGYGTCAVFKESGGKALGSVLSACPIYAENFAPSIIGPASATN